MKTRSRGVLAAMRDSGIGKPRTGKSGEREGGQIIVLFALSIVVMLVFAAIVVDLGVLRNNKQILVNSVDAAALAGGTVMPVDGSDNTLDSNGKTPRQAAYDLIKATLLANYGSLTASQYQITFRCLIGIDKSSPPKANVTRDVPIVCDPGKSLAWTGSTTLAQKQAFFTGAGDTRSSSCDPFLGDKCNTVVVSASSDTNYSFGRVVGVNSGSTGAVQSAACNGPCGQPPSIPVDLVMIIDRTGSMQTSADPSGTAVTSAAAKAVLGVYDPTLQRVALALLGPSSTTETCNGSGGPAVKAVLAKSFSLTAPQYGSNAPTTGTTGGAGTLVISGPSNTSSGDFLIAGITVDGGSTTTITPPTGAGGGWTLIRRTDNATNVGVASYYKVATASEPASYSFGISPSARSSGGIIRLTGVDTADPIDASSQNTGGPGTAVQASAVTTSGAQRMLVGFYGIDTRTTFTPPNSTTERFDVRNGSSGDPGPSTEGTTDPQTNAGSSGTKTATAGASARWAAQLIAVNPAPTDYYGTDPTNPTDLATWIPVGFTGTDADTPAPAYNEAYSDGNGTLNSASHIMSAINCFDSGKNTNLASPIAMASYYLQHYGRPNVKWGIILETDGEPNYGGYGDSNDYTCAQTSANATAAKGIKNANGDAIEIFSIGFFDTDSNGNTVVPTCRDTSGAWRNQSVTKLLANVATSSNDNGCTTAENTDGDNFFCEPKSSDLAAIFSTVASQLSGIRTHIVSLYPAPIVSSLSSSVGTHNGGLSINVTGKYFTGSTSVRMGGAAVPFTINSDTSITISSTAPGTTGSTVDIVVTNPGGSSPIVNGDRYTYN